MKVEGYFSGIKNANEAVEKLKKAGFTNSFADLNDHYTLDNNANTNIPGSDNGSSEAGLILNAGEPLDDPSKGPLAAASPMVSGMGGFEEIADVNYRVSVEVDEKYAEKVKQILNKMGGDLRDPNFKVPEGIENISIDEMMNNMLS